jgi:hypothetical protein
VAEPIASSLAAFRAEYNAEPVVIDGETICGDRIAFAQPVARSSVRLEAPPLPQWRNCRSEVLRLIEKRPRKGGEEREEREKKEGRYTF